MGSRLREADAMIISPLVIDQDNRISNLLVSRGIAPRIVVPLALVLVLALANLFEVVRLDGNAIAVEICDLELLRVLDRIQK